MSTAAVVAIVAIVVALVVVAIAWRIQNHTVRRLMEVLGRLDDSGPDLARREMAIDRLERSVERVRARDDRFHQNEARLGLALSEMTQGAVVCDARGVVTYRNAFAQSFAGARHGEALVEAAISELLAMANAGTASDRELELFGPPKRTLVVHAVPLRHEGEMVGAVALIDDITEMQRLDSIRRDFVANVSHELKTPIGALALLAETLAGESDPDVVHRLSERVRNEAFRVSHMVDDLLTLSRIEGHDRPTVDRFGVDLLIRECVDRVHPLAEQRGVRLDVGSIDGELRLRADRRQIASAISNLLENAVKYSEENAVVQTRVSATDLDVVIVVQDHGIGIPASDLERIFERFYRVDKARSRDTGGSGLGLAIARHVARNHGGDVTVVSREGEGSTFALVLPREAGGDEDEQ